MQLFFYGVLMADIASPAIAEMLYGLGPGRRASVAGRLMAILDPRGAYPVLLARNGEGEGRVWGMVYKAGSVDIARLDAFEGIEYRRASVTALREDGEQVQAQAYLYQFPPRADFVPIPHGDFARWLKETGTVPLAG